MNLQDANSESGSTRRRIAVIGGGFCGLAAAHRLLELGKDSGRGCDVTVFDAGESFGGLVRTKRIQDYLVECGADSFITNKPAAIQLCRRLGLESELIATDATYRRSLVLFRGKPHPVPDGFQLLAPASIASIIKSPLFSWGGKLRMALEPFIPKRSSGEDESLASFVKRRLGNEALERLIQPMVGGIYTADPERLSLRATMPRFLEMEEKHGSLLRAMAVGSSNESQGGEASGARYGLFATLRGGLSDLTTALEKRVTELGGKLRAGTRVTKLTRMEAIEGKYRIELVNRNPEDFEGVVMALPTRAAAELAEPLRKDLANELRKIEYASSAIVVSGHRLSEIRDSMEAFGLVVPAVESREILAVSFSSRKFPGRAPEGKILLRTFIGGAMQPDQFQRDDSEMKGLVRNELREIFGVTGEPDFMEVCRYPHSMPQYHVGHLGLVGRIRAEASKLPGFALAGNAYDGVGIPDTIASGEQAAAQVWG